MSARVTMRDLARAVGVSPMTISRALRDDATVSARTRAEVRKVAAELGYVYDTTAQAFRTQKSGFIAVTLPSLNNANFAETFRGLSEGLSEAGLQVLLGSTGYSLQREEDLIRQLLARNPEALVLTGGHHSEATRALLAARDIPIIETWDLPADPLGHVVGFSNADAMGLVVRHLAETGRRRLAFVGATEGADFRGLARRDGALHAAKALGLPPVDVLEAGPAPVTMRHGAELVAKIGREVARYDAVMCVSDPVAFGCLSACQRLGLSVPQDVAITGFGQFEVSQVAHPRITTVGVNAREIGRRAALILAQSTASNPQESIDLSAMLLCGETS